MVNKIFKDKYKFRPSDLVYLWGFLMIFIWYFSAYLALLARWNNES